MSLRKSPVSVLLDQNIPQGITAWLKELRPEWDVEHVNQVGLAGKADAEVFQYAQTHRALVVTFDEDFGDARSHKLGSHAGIIRLRVWPTTTAEVKAALLRLIDAVPEKEWPGSLMIVHAARIRIRKSSKRDRR